MNTVHVIDDDWRMNNSSFLVYHINSNNTYSVAYNTSKGIVLGFELP